MQLGIRTQAYHDDSQIVFLRPQHLKPAAGPLPAQAADLEINLAPEMDKLFETGDIPAACSITNPRKRGSPAST